MEEKKKEILSFLRNTLEPLGWVESSKNLPPIDEHERIIYKNFNSDRSVKVLCYSKEFGICFGYYHHRYGTWTLENIHSTDEIKVEKWRYIGEPE